MIKKTRVLQLIDGLNVGGAEILLRDLCSGLHQNGYEVRVGFSTPGPIQQELIALGFEPVHLPRLARIDPIRFGSGLIHLIQKFKPDIVHTHLFKSDFHGRIAAQLSKTPVIISTLHNTDPWARNWLFGRLYGISARNASCLIAVSKEVKAFHVKHSHIPSEKIITIPNGVNINNFHFDPEARKRIRKSLGLGMNTPVIGIIGRLKPQKDHAAFLNAAELIIKQVPDARFLIVGDGPLLSELENLAKKLQISSVALFCGVRTDIPSILSALDILVFSSLWEGLPVSLLEGMAAGCAIVSTAIPGIQEVIKTDETGVLVDPGDVCALANACVSLLGDDIKRQRLGEKAKKLVAGNFSLETMIKQTMIVYENSLNQIGLQSTNNLVNAK